MAAAMAVALPARRREVQKGADAPAGQPQILSNWRLLASTGASAREVRMALAIDHTSTRLLIEHEIGADAKHGRFEA